MKKLLLLPFLFYLICVYAAPSGDDDYSVLKIPAALLKHANIVIRNYSRKVEIESISKTRITEKYAITILNEAGEGFAQFVEQYDKLSSVKNIDGKLFDAYGKKLKDLKKNEIKDISNVSDISLYDDNRVKLHNFYYKVFPYTVEYESEVVNDGTFFIPPFFPQLGYFVAVEKSNYILTCPASLKIIYKKINFDKEPEITDAGKDQKAYSWQVTGLSAMQKESLSLSFGKIAPCVRIALTDFEFEGYRGNNTSWKDFGKFVFELKKNRDELPDEVKAKVHQLTTGELSKKEQVTKLYKYLQDNTRYISVQLGVGGFQPFDAKYVAANKYGDCKALSNYMFALLKQSGIPSYYTIIKAGDDEDDVLTDFTANQFNHVILCVPDGKDTIWLECTDQFKSAGYMGDFTGNRHALLITEEGGVLVKTPHYTMNDNLQVRKINAVLEEDGTLKFSARNQYFAMQQDDIHLMYTRLTKDKWKERLQSGFDFPTYNINSYDYQEIKNKLPCMNETLDFTVFNYATITGKRLFIVPNIMTRNYRRYSLDSTRKYDIDMGWAYKDVDSVEIQLPAGYSQEAMPQDINLTGKFASYNSTYKMDKNKILYQRTIEYKGGVFPTSDYPDLVKFYDAVYKADRNRIVLVKKEIEPKPF